MNRWLVFVLLVAVAGCAAEDDRKEGGKAAPGFYMGVTYSPRNWPSAVTQTDIDDFYNGIGDYGNVVGYHTNWRDVGASNGEIPQIAQQAIGAVTQYGGHTYMVGFGWHSDTAGADLTSDSESGNNTWSNAETRNEFRTMVANFCSANQPRLIFLGNEINSYYLDDLTLPGDQQLWDDWVSQFGECYDAIKAVSPNTLVFTVFQFEKMKGVGSKVAWNYAPNWHLIADFGTKLDGLGFTTYPHFQYDTPGDIPAGYYDEISTYWQGPVLFTEIGWSPAASPFGGTQQEQSDFVSTFFTLAANLDLRYATWLFLHDPPGLPSPFAEISFKNNDGTITRMADATWRAEWNARK